MGPEFARLGSWAIGCWRLDDGDDAFDPGKGPGMTAAEVGSTCVLRTCSRIKYKKIMVKRGERD